MDDEREREIEREKVERWTRNIYYDSLRMQLIIYVYCSILIFIVYANHIL